MTMLEELKRRNVIRVGIAYVLVAWLFLQAADFGLDLIDAPNWVIQALFLLALIGLPGALVFSWVYEMTPEGLKREREVDRSQSITGQTGQKLNRVIISVLSLVIVLLLAERFVHTPAPETTGDDAGSPTVADTAPEPSPATVTDAASVAVLPFTNMSNDPDNEYFSDGLTETLLHMLAQLPELRVAARTSSFAFKGSDAGIPEIAATLNVAHVLEGSVQKAGERVRVTAQLVRAEDGFHVWSQNYTRPLEDIFAIQDEIASDVARALDSSLLGGGETLQGVETTSMTAYETYLRALEQQAQFSYASLPAADSLFKEALAQDPDFIDAKLGLARNQYKMSVTGLLSWEAAWAQSEPLLRQVLAADPDNRKAKVIGLAYETWLSAPRSLEAQRVAVDELRNLLPLVPTESFIRGNTAVVAYFRLNDPELAMALLDAGLLIDPLDPSLLAQKGSILGQLDRFSEAEAFVLKSLEYRPQDPNTLADMADIQERQGDIVGALEWMRRAAEADPRDHELAADIAETLYDLDLAEEGDRWAQRVFAQAAQSPVGRKIGLLQARARQDTERVIELSRAMIEDDVSIRHGSLGRAAFLYAQAMANTGRSEEGLAFFEAVRPEAMALNGETLEFGDALVLLAAFHWIPLERTPEEALEAWAFAKRSLDLSLPRWRENPRNQIWEAVLTGDREAALQIAEEDLFSLPPGRILNVDNMFSSPVFANLAAEPNIQTALARLERDKTSIRDDVRELLLQPEWNE